MVKPYQNSSSSKKEQVTTMFDGIADNYDSLNRVISMGIDKSWRRKLVAMAANKKPETKLLMSQLELEIWPLH